MSNCSSRGIYFFLERRRDCEPSLAQQPRPWLGHYPRWCQGRGPPQSSLMTPPRFSKNSWASSQPFSMMPTRQLRRQLMLLHEAALQAGTGSTPSASYPWIGPRPSRPLTATCSNRRPKQLLVGLVDSTTTSSPTFLRPPSTPTRESPLVRTTSFLVPPRPRTLLGLAPRLQRHRLTCSPAT